MHPLTNNIKGLYAIVDTGTLSDEEMYEKVEQVIAGGCRVLQYRDKSRAAKKRFRQASRLQKMCHQAGVVFIINDDADLAHKVRADGVHCGIEDDSIIDVRGRYPNLLIGASCYNSLDRAKKAVEGGADYIAFGRFFTSPTKPQAAPADVKILLQAVKKYQKPVVAIGGINTSNAEILVSSGASAVAVISGLFSVPNSFASSKKIAALFN